MPWCMIDRGTVGLLPGWQALETACSRSIKMAIVYITVDYSFSCTVRSPADNIDVWFEVGLSRRVNVRGTAL